MSRQRNGEQQRRTEVMDLWLILPSLMSSPTRSKNLMMRDGTGGTMKLPAQPTAACTNTKMHADNFWAHFQSQHD